MRDGPSVRLLWSEGLHLKKFDKNDKTNLYYCMALYIQGVRQKAQFIFGHPHSLTLLAFGRFAGY